MQLDVQFVIDNNKKIRVTVPDLPDKENEIYTPTKELHKYDLATVEYIQEKASFFITQETIMEIFLSSYITIERGLAGLLTFDDNIKPGTVGKLINQFYNNIFNIWLGKYIDTLLYNVNDTIYIEVVPAYPWLHVPPENHETYISFKHFIDAYKPYVYTAIPEEQCITWKNTCYDVLKTILDKNDIPHSNDVLALLS